MADSVETAVNLSDGLLIVEYENETLPKKFRKRESVTFSSKFSCPESGFTIEEIEPRLFSFNSPYGACEECEGIGHNLNVDPNLVISDPKKSSGWCYRTLVKINVYVLCANTRFYCKTLQDFYDRFVEKNSKKKFRI